MIASVRISAQACGLSAGMEDRVPSSLLLEVGSHEIGRIRQSVRQEAFAEDMERYIDSPPQIPWR